MEYIQIWLLLLIAIFPNINAESSESSERPCGSNMQNLWLDVVVLVDNSVGMTQQGMTQVAAQVSTIFGQGTTIGTSKSADPRNTRVSLITYNSDAKIVANLDKFQSYEDLISGVFEELQVSTVDVSNIDEGLIAAIKVLNQGRANDYRLNYKQILMIYASEYRDDGSHDPVYLADRLKADDVKILTVAFDQDGEDEALLKLSELASPGYGFSNTDNNVVQEVQNALVQTNCYCPNFWVQYRQNYYDEESVSYGTCFYAAPLQAAWSPAKFACQNRAKNGFLINEESQQKHDFIFQVVSNASDVQKPYIYHIGLSFLNGIWAWEQPNGHALKPLNNSMWNPGFPISPTTANAVLNQQNGQILQAGWQNVNAYTVSKNYVCEVSTCDTDNYCT